MNKAIKYGVALGMWVVDLALGFWLFYIGQTALMGIMALFYEPGEWQYEKIITATNKFAILIFGLAWLVFTIVIQEYFMNGVNEGEMFKRFARVNGPLLICIFVIDLIIFWLQGVPGNNFFRWFILAAELGLGLALTVFYKRKSIEKLKAQS